MGKKISRGIGRMIAFMLSAMLLLSNPVSVEAKAANTYAKYINQNGVYYSVLPKKYKKGYAIARKEYKSNKAKGDGNSMTEVLGKFVFLADHTSALNNSSKPLSVKYSKKTYLAAKKLARVAKGKKSKYEKALALHDALMTTVKYGSGRYAGQTAYEALTGNKTAVCAGISRAYKLMCDIVGIKCYCVFGNAGGVGDSGAHQWNIIKLDDGKWYEVDVTFDIGLNNSHEFFCLSTDDMANREVGGYQYFHQRTGLDEPTNLLMSITPVATGTKYAHLIK